MTNCTMCGTLYTGETRDGLCAACYLKDRARIYTDPADPDEWLKRQYQRLESREKLEAAMEGREWVDSHPSGRCPICKNVLDDHSLTYTEKPSGLGLCQKKKAKA